eukprot:1321317-Rhodomonas_salina.1
MAREGREHLRGEVDSPEDGHVRPGHEQPSEGEDRAQDSEHANCETALDVRQQIRQRGAVSNVHHFRCGRLMFHG